MPVTKHRASGIPVYTVNHKKTKKVRKFPPPSTKSISKCASVSRQQQLTLHPDFAKQLLLVLVKYLQERKGVSRASDLMRECSIAISNAASYNQANQIIKNKDKVNDKDEEEDEDNTLAGFSVNKEDSLDALSGNKDNTYDIYKDETVEGVCVNKVSTIDGLFPKKDDRLDDLCDQDKLIVLKCTRNGLTNLIEKELTKANQDVNKSIESKQASTRKAESRRSPTRIPVRQRSLGNVHVDQDNKRLSKGKVSNTISSVSKSAKVKRHSSEHSLQVRISLTPVPEQVSPPKSSSKEASPDNLELSPCLPDKSTSLASKSKTLSGISEKPPSGRDISYSEFSDDIKPNLKTSILSNRSILTAKDNKRKLKENKTKLNGYKTKLRDHKSKLQTRSKHKYFYDIRDFLDIEDHKRRRRTANGKPPIYRSPSDSKGTTESTSLDRQEFSSSFSLKDQNQRQNFYKKTLSSTSSSRESSILFSDESFESCTTLSDSKENSIQIHRQYQNLVSHVVDNFQCINHVRKTSINNIIHEPFVVESDYSFQEQQNDVYYPCNFGDHHNSDWCPRSFSSASSTKAPDVKHTERALLNNKISDSESSSADPYGSRWNGRVQPSLSGNISASSSEHFLNNSLRNPETSLTDRSIHRSVTSQIFNSASNKRVSFSSSVSYCRENPSIEDFQGINDSDFDNKDDLANVLYNNQLLLSSVWPDVKTAVVFFFKFVAVYGILVVIFRIWRRIVS